MKWREGRDHGVGGEKRERRSGHGTNGARQKQTKQKKETDRQAKKADPPIDVFLLFGCRWGSVCLTTNADRPPLSSGNGCGDQAPAQTTAPGFAPPPNTSPLPFNRIDYPLAFAFCAFIDICPGASPSFPPIFFFHEKEQARPAANLY